MDSDRLSHASLGWAAVVRAKLEVPGRRISLQCLETLQASHQWKQARCRHREDMGWGSCSRHPDAVMQLNISEGRQHCKKLTKHPWVRISSLRIHYRAL